MRRYYNQQVRAIIGVSVDSLPQSEATFASAVGPARAPSLLAGTLIWADFAARGNQWPVTDTANGDPRIALVSTLATGDTARFRARLARFDSLALAATEEPDNGLALLGIEAHLAVHDSAGAMRWFTHFTEQTWNQSPIMDQPASGFVFEGLLWPRLFLRGGDLAAGLGQRDVATRAYRAVVGYWAHGDADVQPFVQRARAALARLGS